MFSKIFKNMFSKIFKKIVTLVGILEEMSYEELQRRDQRKLLMINLELYFGFISEKNTL